jgi:uncharacterized protein YecT (DUF1311 family)
MKHALAICSILFTMGAAPEVDPTGRADVSLVRTSTYRCLADAQTSPEVTGCLVDENDELDRALAGYLNEVGRSLTESARDALMARQAAWRRYRDQVFAPTPNAGMNGRPSERTAVLNQRLDETLNRFYWVAEETSDYREPKPYEALPSPEARLRILNAQKDFYRGRRQTTGLSEAATREPRGGARMKSEFTAVLTDFFNARLSELPEAQRQRARRGQTLWEEYRRTSCDSDDCWLRETRRRFHWVATLVPNGGDR